MPPPDSFLEQDPPNLAPLHLDALVVCRPSQRIQTPLCVLLWLAGTELVAHPLGPTRWNGPSQRNDRPSLLLGESRFPSCPWSITQAIEALCVEADDPFTDGLRMATQLRGNHGGPLALPAADNHLGTQDPVGWRVTTPCQPADLVLFLCIKRGRASNSFGMIVSFGSAAARFARAA